jgi:hypothetical protein
MLDQIKPKRINAEVTMTDLDTLRESERNDWERAGIKQFGSRIVPLDLPTWSPLYSLDWGKPTESTAALDEALDCIQDGEPGEEMLG